MSFYHKYLIVAGVIGIVGIPIFVFDHTDWSWVNNREAYWGMIAFACLILSILLTNRVRRLEE